MGIGTLSNALLWTWAAGKCILVHCKGLSDGVAYTYADIGFFLLAEMCFAAGRPAAVWCLASCPASPPASPNWERASCQIL